MHDALPPAAHINRTGSRTLSNTGSQSANAYGQTSSARSAKSSAGANDEKCNRRGMASAGRRGGRGGGGGQHGGASSRTQSPLQGQLGIQRCQQAYYRRRNDTMVARSTCRDAKLAILPRLSGASCSMKSEGRRPHRAATGLEHAPLASALALSRMRVPHFVVAHDGSPTAAAWRAGSKCVNVQRGRWSTLARACAAGRVQCRFSCVLHPNSVSLLHGAPRPANIKRSLNPVANSGCCSRASFPTEA